MSILAKCFERLNEAIEVENTARLEDRLGRNELIPRTEIRIMGQMSLLTNDVVSAQIHLIGTVDVDASIDGGPYSWVGKKFAEILAIDGLELDKYADEIWLPTGASFTEVFSKKNLRCVRLEPIPALISKAVKAPVKNRILIRQALAVFPELKPLIEAHGGDISNFEGEE